MLNGFFVCNDQPRSLYCHKMTVAICAEPPDLEKASVRVIQIDEAPLQKGAAVGESQCARDLRRAAESFLIASDRDADVITI